MLKLFNFTCTQCTTEWEDLVDAEGLSPCPDCQEERPRDAISCPKLATFAMLSKADKATALKKRSADHSKKELRKEAEQFGSFGKQLAREGQIRSFGGLGKSR
jgi:hypothetical protein